jgi:hypothetical protein
MPTRTKLDAIRSLTFYKDTETQSRRGSYLPQLNCIGKPCKLYTPDVVRCVNAGGSGTDVDWKVRLVFSSGNMPYNLNHLVWNSVRLIYRKHFDSDEWRYPVKDGMDQETSLS